MIPTRAMLVRIATAIQNQLIAMNGADNLAVFAVGIDFTASPNTAVADVPTLVFNTTFGPPNVRTADFQTGADPVTGEEVIVFGFTSSATADRQLIDFTDVPLPKQVFGYAMKGLGDTLIAGSKRFDVPILYTRTLQIRQWGEISFRYPTAAIR